MKTKILYIVCVIVLCGFAYPAIAQEEGYDRQGRGDFSAHWLLGSPVGNDFVKNFTGWGGNLEGHYFVTNQVAVGLFVSWNTYMEYFPRATYPLTNGNGAITMDKYHTIFELPFGVSSKFHLTSTSGIVDPYIGLKMGANYSRQRQYYNIFEDYDENWGFVVQPELGITVSPMENRMVAFNLSIFYSYSTNSSDYFDISGLSDLGLRLGLNFRF